VSDQLRVLVADDHRGMRDALVRLLSTEFDVVACVADGEAAVSEAVRLAPDFVVLDIAMPELDGMTAAAQMKAAGSTAKVVFVTNFRDREFLRQSLVLGEVGFVAKDSVVADLVPAIRSVLAGHSFVSPAFARGLA
jgi:DNA-binding NarL/FixJ family response regulator